MKYKTLSLLLTISLLFTHCSKHDDIDFKRIIIKGTISNSSLKNSTIKSSSSLSLNDAKKVLVFDSSGGYKLFFIENESFTATAMPGTASALVFLGDNNAYIGCLHSGGLNVLPLVSLKDGDNTVIDLSTLSLEGTNVIPSNITAMDKAIWQKDSGDCESQSPYEKFKPPSGFFG